MRQNKATKTNVNSYYKLVMFTGKKYNINNCELFPLSAWENYDANRRGSVLETLPGPSNCPYRRFARLRCTSLGPTATTTTTTHAVRQNRRKEISILNHKNAKCGKKNGQIITLVNATLFSM